MKDKTVIRRAYKFRAYPNIGTRRQLWNMLRRAATPVWNACVAEREQARAEYFKKLDVAFSDFAGEHRRDLTEDEEKAIRKQVSSQIKWPSAWSQYDHIRKAPDKKDRNKPFHPEYEPYSSSMLECTIAKVDGSEKSYRALLLKGDKKARPPKQKNIVQCLTFRQSGYKYEPPKEGSETGYLTITQGITDRIKLRVHREIEGTIKTVSITQKNGKWYVSFSCELTNFHGTCGPVSAPKSWVTHDLQEKYTPLGGADPETTTKQDSVTLYLPGNVFLCDSTGRVVEHPEFYASKINVLRRLSRSLSRKRQTNPGMKGKREGDFRGRNRLKAKRRLSKWHEHIAARREHFLWAWARYYAANFKEINVPKWPLKMEIQYAMESKTAQRLCDGAYGKFIEMLKQKVEQFGSKVTFMPESEWHVMLVRHLEAVKAFEERKQLLRDVKKSLKHNNQERVRRSIDTYKRKYA